MPNKSQDDKTEPTAPAEPTTEPVEDEEMVTLFFTEDGTPADPNMEARSDVHTRLVPSSLRDARDEAELDKRLKEAEG